MVCLGRKYALTSSKVRLFEFHHPGFVEPRTTGRPAPLLADIRRTRRLGRQVGASNASTINDTALPALFHLPHFTPLPHSSRHQSPLLKTTLRPSLPLNMTACSDPSAMHAASTAPAISRVTGTRVFTRRMREAST